jgi:GNAT superfamily N-acetyltransferase
MGSREELLERMARSLQAWQRALGCAATGGEVVEVGGLVGSIVPAVPSRSILNAAALARGMSLEPGVIATVASRYADAGISAWGVWMHEDETESGAVLAASGLTIDSRPTAMGLHLLTLGPAAAPEGISVERTRDVALLAEPLAAGYGFPPALLTGGLPGLLDYAEGWVALVDGVPASGAVVVRCAGDAGIFLVATAPSLRGRGAAEAVVRHALLHARAAGCTTSTLQSSEMGRSVYERIGYAAVGTYLLWEQRSS